MITKLEPNEVFVFGSNTAGQHDGGAALQALEQFGAEYGVGEGMTGQCYAFPTLDERLSKVSSQSLEVSRNLLYACCKANAEKRFLLTKVGCGIAGFAEQGMRALFTNAPDNLMLPEEWMGK